MGAEQLTRDSVIHRSDAVIASQLGDDVVMMDVEEGVYYGLESVAARIWALTEQPTSIGTLCATLAGEYDVPPARCEQEVVTFIGELIDRRIVQVTIS